MIKEAIEKVTEHISLSENEMELVIDEIMSGNATDAQIASFITALRIKGETVEEITGAAKVMRDKATKVYSSKKVLVDTCGTGGDRKGTFNVSTAASFIAAGAGVFIAKHGNRSVSSKSGSADVLEALGINVKMGAGKARHAIETIGMCFLFAPIYHGAMKYAIGPRQQIGIRTIFNMLGPLTNPAEAKYQVIGIYDGTMTEKIAHVLHNLGSIAACVVHGDDGTDEITLTGKTTISELKNDRIKTYKFDPEEYGYKCCSPEKLLGGDADRNAAIIMDILNGAGGAMRDIAELNAAFAIYIANIKDNLHDAIIAARESIDSGLALKKLDGLKKLSNEDNLK
ncbi:MAG: anthranilate phosphoribosyltransferase [Deltaproteobacteria bacterium]|nr:anthranilate phosphoribosyltransferase [Deltaproteobacteria bacterium]MCL5791860.1 anthranilate phosphoribosyltransferase [Deltaproteobacteria bacterium]